MGPPGEEHRVTLGGFGVRGGGKRFRGSLGSSPPRLFFERTWREARLRPPSQRPAGSYTQLCFDWKGIKDSSPREDSFSHKSCVSFSEFLSLLALPPYSTCLELVDISYFSPKAPSAHYLPSPQSCPPVSRVGGGRENKIRSPSGTSWIKPERREFLSGLGYEWHGLREREFGLWATGASDPSRPRVEMGLLPSFRPSVPTASDRKSVV